MAKKTAQPDDGFELVFGVVAAVGTDTSVVENALRNSLESHFNYRLITYRLSKQIETLASKFNLDLHKRPEFKRLNSFMTAGDGLRGRTGCHEILAKQTVSEISLSRSREPSDLRRPLPRTAHLLLSLKHPDEIRHLRDVYGAGIFVIGLYASEAERKKFLIDEKGLRDAEAKKVIERDHNEPEPHGQHVSDAFQHADVFLRVGPGVSEDVRRFLDLVFGDPFSTPTKDEHAMFLAYASSLRSGSLSRQVGAVIVTQRGDVIASGANDAPRAGGGLYWPDDGLADRRDFRIGSDSNEKARILIARELIKSVGSDVWGSKTDAEIKDLIRGTRVAEITEYGRDVHAEMEALLACARVGVSPVGATLFCTTYPCHNCAKHIVAAGINRVVFVEPYEKSQALELHGDAVTRADPQRSPSSGRRATNSKVRFEPFVGVGARRYVDLFSLGWGSGSKIDRKNRDGKMRGREQHRNDGVPRVPMARDNYLTREVKSAEELNDIISRLGVRR